MSLLDAIKTMVSGTDYGPVVKLGKKQYYMAHLQGETLSTGAKSGAVLFSTVNPKNENQNVSLLTIPPNSSVGKVLTVIGESDHPYLVTESSYGKLFVDPADLDSSVLDKMGIPDITAIAAKQKEADDKNPTKDMKNGLLYLLLIVVLIVFFPVIRKYSK
jgi:rRNA processing protein Gar1